MRTQNPKVVEGTEMVIEAGKSWSKDIAFSGLGGTNKVTVELSTIPSIGMEQQMDYLIRYPMVVLSKPLLRYSHSYM